MNTDEPLVQFHFETSDADARTVDYRVGADRAAVIRTFDMSGRETSRRSVTADAAAPVVGSPFAVKVLPNLSPYQTGPVTAVIDARDLRADV